MAEVAEVTPALVKSLRDKTGAGMMDCKKALLASDGDLERATDWLREKGIAQAEKLSSRTADEGLVDSYIHAGGRIGVLLEISCETDFVAKTEDFKMLLHDVAMHVAAASPQYLRRDDVPAEAVEAERQVQVARVREEGKPEKVAEKIITGRMDKYFAEICLEEQAYVKDPAKTVVERVKETSAKLGEKMEIKRFARFQVGGN